MAAASPAPSPPDPRTWATPRPASGLTRSAATARREGPLGRRARGGSGRPAAREHRDQLPGGASPFAPNGGQSAVGLHCALARLGHIALRAGQPLRLVAVLLGRVQHVRHEDCERMRRRGSEILTGSPLGWQPAAPLPYSSLLNGLILRRAVGEILPPRPAEECRGHESGSEVARHPGSRNPATPLPQVLSHLPSPRLVSRPASPAWLWHHRLPPPLAGLEPLLRQAQLVGGGGARAPARRKWAAGDPCPVGVDELPPAGAPGAPSGGPLF